MKSNYREWSRNRRPQAEEDALNGNAPRAKNASDNRSPDRFHSECPGTHTTTPTRPRAAKPGDHEQKRQTPTDARRRGTTERTPGRANQSRHRTGEAAPSRGRADENESTAHPDHRLENEKASRDGPRRNRRRSATRDAKTIEAIGNNIRTGDKRRPAKPEPTNESGRRRLGSDIDQAGPSRRTALTGGARRRRSRLLE